ncbi:translocation/assembly module TamB [Pararcticibacter amylolyticus]|uniref:Translocation/assembly module TamB n=1 Tax=Pararcticibacter amylolyticus TaxID=2173175 RepID=A0A2U2PBT6_9SPHI|nr:translocation/assembly module TamB domain-containing protein [Pararcticibacter amylolyticus]PWG78861.1 translocation/assembly module TamB [Pararcticibacter amylolyticus]
MWTLSVIAILIASLIIALQFKPVQTYIAKRAARYLSKELNTTIGIKSLYIKPLKSLVLEDFYIQDLDKDTLLYTPRLSVDLNLFSLRQRKVSVNTAQLDNGKFFLKQYKDGKTNLQFIINYFDSGKPAPKKKPSKKPFDITFDRIVLNNTAFKYRNYNNQDTIKGINFDDVSLYQLNTTILNLDTKNHLFKAGIRDMSFREKSGFYLKNLSTDAVIDSNSMEFKNLLLETPNTTIRNYVLMKYANFGDFNDFIRKVYVKGHLRNSVVFSKDIAYFTDALDAMNIKLRMNGDLSGYVDNFRARNFSVKAGQATYVKGNFNIKGLPYINKTSLNLTVNQLATNKKDADYIIKAFSGKTGLIPPIAEKFGNIYFKGSFNGMLKDFRAAGEFKTSLGRIIPDIKMNLYKEPVYSGTIAAQDLNLRELLQQRDLGRASFKANIKGSGFNIRKLKENLDVTADYFDFHGYRYSALNINGTLSDKLFSGQLAVDDRNLQLNFKGDVNLSPSLPQFNFNADIRHANLHKLNLSKDTIQLETQLRSNFSGNSIENLQGDLQLSGLRLTNRDSSLLVNSITLTASGLGGSRLIAINSELLEASIRGEYDLKTLPSYFKSVAKRYVPSLKTTIVKHGNQNFNLYIKIKDFAPFSMLLIPDLSLPDGAVFYGRFVSADSIAAVNGSSPLIRYKKIKVNNFILDESAGKNALNIFLTADRIDITDSLYIKNINIANVVHNDSLALNVKLSDKDATNQLDLNALVEFGTDTLAKLSILPSDFVINKESWKVPEQVKFRFDPGKIFIEDFELSRNDQLLTINGIVSASHDDKLDIEFKKFQAATFNPLTRGAGMIMTGEMNGNISISSVTKTPKIESELSVDSLTMNNISIGKLALNAEVDNETKLVDVNMDIVRNGQKTMNVKGTYDAGAAKNTLDLSVEMNNNQLVIFQPFIRHLVSDVSGEASARLNVSGNILDPKINGTLSLKEANLTVNYLKTPYKITDDVTVENSVIRLNGLQLTDISNNTATANGTVNMKDPGNPDIDVSVRTSKFMVLNTTAKDNPIYYGTAYATGMFRFKGPTDNMRIDINAKTEEGTVFNIPLNASETVANNDFITFVAKDSTFTPKNQSFFLPGLVLNMDLTVDENSLVNIYTNLGRLNGRGNANINLKITSQGDFEMYGDYLISSGKFQFTAQDFINKIFDLSQGGSIRWTGDPTDALINLRAIYSLRTDIRPLYVAAGRPPIEGRYQTEAIMNLSGNLMRPDISFDINFPNDANIKDELQTYFNDVNNKNTQALSLIVRRSFSPNTGNVNVQAVNNTLFSAGTELLVNQFNNILAQWLNLNFVDLNIRSFNEASASFRFMKDRLVITAGVTDRRADVTDYSIIGNNVTRDAEMLYLIQKDGSLTARVSNRLNNRNFLNPDQEYISAVGLVYRQDFETLGEFLRALIGQRRREERARRGTSSPLPTSPGQPSRSPAILPSSAESGKRQR